MTSADPYARIHDTLDPAEECRDDGHSYDVIDVRSFDDPTGRPVAVVCTRCRAHWDITEPDPAPAPGPYRQRHIINQTDDG